ncbi:hypothetical protein JOS77_28320 [Chromobacterium haemolyticum]|nr:hypothetical protein JOS77_28320 [Chromobacterium haemolyticum]
MSKQHELDKERLRHSTSIQKWQIFAKTLTSFGGYGTALLAIWLVLSGLEPLISGKSAQDLKALAEIVSAMQLHTIVGYALAAVTTTAWYYERSGKKRAIEMKSFYQQKLEGGEPNRSSSGLTPTGETPN